MRRFAIVLLWILFALALFWVGLMYNFPGETMSRFVSAQVNRAQGFDLALSPAELRWNRLYVERAELKRRDNPAAQPLFVLKDFAVPITWRLILGLPAQGVIGDNGRVEAFLPWREGGEAWMDGAVRLEEIPLPKVLPPFQLNGEFRFSGRFEMNAQSQLGQQLPPGVLEGKASGLVITGLKAGDTSLPPTRMDKVDFSLSTGRIVKVDTFQVEGDLQGNVEGTITPNMRDPRNSLLAVSSTLSLRNSWLSQLGDLQPVVEGFLRNGRIRLRLSGTVGRPRLTPMR